MHVIFLICMGVIRTGTPKLTETGAYPYNFCSFVAAEHRRVMANADPWFCVRACSLNSKFKHKLASAT